MQLEQSSNEVLSDRDIHAHLFLDWDAVKLQLGSEYRLPNYWKHPIIQLLL